MQWKRQIKKIKESKWKIKKTEGPKKKGIIMWINSTSYRDMLSPLDFVNS